MSQYDIERFVEELEDYLKYSYNKSKFWELLKEFQQTIEENKRLNEGKTISETYDRFSDLIHLFSNSTYSEPLVLILKNNLENFDFYVFRHGLEIELNEVVSSENFMDKIRNNPREGMVIGNVKPKEALDFLKAYYIFRGEVKQSETAQNITYEYNNECLEMLSILDKFDGTENNASLEVKNTILYDNDALPYELSYLDNYRKNVAHDNTKFKEILKNVRGNKYLGTSLRKVTRWWS